MRNRFDWHPKARFTVWAYFAPIVILIVPSMMFRARFENYPQGFLRDLPFTLAFLLLAYPFVVNLFAPLFGGERYSFYYLVDEPWKLFRSFFAYNPKNGTHPAVFQSPAGPTYCRLFACMGVLLLFAPVSFPNHYYQLDVDSAYHQWVQNMLDLERRHNLPIPESEKSLHQKMHEFIHGTSEPTGESARQLLERFQPSSSDGSNWKSFTGLDTVTLSNCSSRPPQMVPIGSHPNSSTYNL